MINQRSIEIRSYCLKKLDGCLGTYYLPSHQQEKAIAVNRSITNQSYPPKGTKVEGLECQIYLPFIDANSIIEGVALESTWRIYLKQWDNSKTTQLGFLKLIKGFPYSLKSTFLNPPNRSIAQDINSNAISQPEIYRIDFCFWERFG